MLALRSLLIAAQHITAHTNAVFTLQLRPEARHPLGFTFQLKGKSNNVSIVYAGGAASKAGMRAGDLVVFVNGKQIGEVGGALQEIIRLHEQGTLTFVFEVQRGEGSATRNRALMQREDIHFSPSHQSSLHEHAPHHWSAQGLHGMAPDVPRVYALMPTRASFVLTSNPAASYLADAGVSVRLLANFSSMFAAYSFGVDELQPADEDIVLLVHDDVAFGTPAVELLSLLRQQLSSSGVGFVGAAGSRVLSPELVWWRSGGNSPGTPIGLASGHAGLVHHGLDPAESERSFFGPFGRVVVLDGVFLAATGVHA